MRRIQSLLSCLLVCGLIGVWGITPAMAQVRERRTIDTIAAQGASSIQLQWNLLAGQVELRPEAMQPVMIADVYATADIVRNDFAYEVRQGTGFLDIDSRHRARHGADDSENEWQVKLSERIPFSLDLEMKACDARFELGGIPITSATLDFGAVSGTIAFSRQIPKRMEKLVIDAGASSLDLRSFGNANCDTIQVHGGAASIDLDLRGTLAGETVVDVEVGMGSVDITLPSDAEIRIEADRDSWFSEIDFDRQRFSRAGRTAWQTERFDQAKERIILLLSVRMGSIDLRWK